MPIIDTPAKIPIRERVSVFYARYAKVDVIDNAFVLIDKNGVRKQIPVGGITCLMLEPGTRITHAAVRLAAEVRCHLVWVGEGGTRLYSAGMPGGARSQHLLYQAKLALDDTLRLRVVRKMYAMRFGEEPPERRSVDQLRGIEGARVREMYKVLAGQYGVTWKGRAYDPAQWMKADVPNRCLSAATAALYGLSEAAIVAAGYSPAIGFIHTGKPQAFVYDVADIFKFETVVPIAFGVAKRRPASPEREVRVACRDMFRRTRLIERLVPAIDEVLAAGGLDPPADVVVKEGQVAPIFFDEPEEQP